jgi:hypothetical protein
MITGFRSRPTDGSLPRDDLREPTDARVDGSDDWDSP